MTMVIKTSAVIVSVSLVYYLVSYYAWEFVNYLSGYGLALTVSAVILVGMLVYFYASVIERIWLRLSPELFETTTAFILLSSIPFFFGGIFGNFGQRQSLIIALILLTITLLSVSIGYYRYRSEKPKQASDRALFFNEANKEKVDLTRGQSAAAETLTSLLSDFVSYHGVGPLSVALNGKWGDGKTTIVNTVIANLNNKNLIVVRFDPWRYTSQESLVSGFYDEIGIAIAGRLPGFRTARIDFAKFARGFIAAISKSDTLANAFSLAKPRSYDFPNKIDRHLRLNDKRLLVIIDDIERLYEDSHITRTLQLAQYLKSDITNSAIVFLTDIAQIESAIPERLNGSVYLQKFFDTTIIVAPPTRTEMLAFMNLFLKKLSIGIDIKLEEDIQLSRLMRNVRGIKRVLSMFANDIDAIGENVKAQDVLFLRSLYYAYPSLYIDIRENTSMYFDYHFDFNDSEFGLYGFNEEDFEQAQKQHLEDLFAEMRLTAEEIKRFKALLEDYLPGLENVFRRPGSGKRHIDYGKLSRERRIGSREYLDRYFILSEDVDKKHELEAMIDSFIAKNWGKSDTDRFKSLRKFYSNNKDSKRLFYELYLQKVRGLEGNDREASSDLRKSHYRDLLRLNVEKTDYESMDNDGTFMRTLGEIDQQLVPDDFPYIFDDLSDYAMHPTISMRIALYLNPRRDNGLYHLRQYDGYNDLRSKILASVDEYYLVKQHNVLTESSTTDKQWIFVVAQWSTSVCYDTQQDFNQERYDKVNAYLIELVENDASLLEKLIQGAFWHNDLISNKYRYTFNSKPQAYDHVLIAEQVRKWLENNPDELADETKAIFEAFSAAHEKFIADQAEGEQEAHSDS